VEELFAPYGLTATDVGAVVAALRERPDAWVDFMMRFELGLERPQPRRARDSAMTIAASYAAGGLVPLLPYMLIASSEAALRLSIVATLAALCAFGWLKGYYTGASRVRSAVQTTLVGALAAGAAFGLARLVR
jgi:VIT1/CCC1 family predicted Fe2+/Mn2+ transporter